MAGMEKLEYHGPVIYRNGKIDMVLFPGGYATIGTDKSVTFHYYTQDYLGNNRAVVNGSTGAIEQTTAYYPYGAVIPDISTDNTGQPFKYGGKELVSANGLNMYDFGARLHYPAIPQFDRVDPMSEKFAWLSPYLYCGNNPVNFIDPSGMVWKEAKEAEVLQKALEQKIANYKKDIEELKKIQTDAKNKKEDTKIKTSIEDLSQRISSLYESIADINKMRDDPNNVYKITSVAGDNQHYVFKGDDGLVYVESSSDALSVHEITHVGQSLDTGGLEFDNDGYLKNAGTKEKRADNMVIKISQNEVESYQRQFSFNPLSMPKKANSVLSIDLHYVGEITLYGGTPAYPVIKRYSEQEKIKNRINSK